jgi:type IV pilus assembly protein PilM
MKYVDHFGLDIGDNEAKVVYLNQTGAGFKLISFASLKLSPGVTVTGDNFDLEETADFIKKAIRDLGISTKRVCLSIPESQVYTRVIETPVISDSELQSAIQWEAEQYVPIPINDVLLRHVILDKPAKESAGAKMDVLLIAAPNTVIERYLKIAKLSGLDLIGIETEVLAVARALVGNDPYSPTTLVISFGGQTTDLAVVKKGNLAFVRSLTTGGDAVSRAITADLKLDSAQAEEYKRIYGLDTTKLDGKVTMAIAPVVDIILAEIKRAVAYYQGKRPDDPIKRAVLVGGMAKMPGLVNYIAQALSTEVQLGNPLANISKSEKQAQEIGENLPNFAVAVGLALKVTE